MIYIVPTILVRTEKGFNERVAAIAPHFNRTQIDVLNDTLVSGSSFADAKAIERGIKELTCEVDLMVTLDGYDLSQWNRHWVDKIIFHSEATTEPQNHIQLIRSWGKKVFMSLNPGTDANLVVPYLKMIDGVLFMTVTPGRSGNLFRHEIVDVIREFHMTHPEVEIEVDGGVTSETMPLLLDAGVSGFAVGSFFDGAHIEENVMQLIETVERFEARSR